MKILPSENRFNSRITVKKQWIPYITFSSQYEIDIMEKYQDIKNADEKLLSLLQFTNDDIVSVDMNNWTYQVIRDSKITKLPIMRLSRGEKLLALCFMANETEQAVYVSYELTQLSKPSIVKFMDMFKNSRFIILIPPTPTIQHILESLNE